MEFSKIEATLVEEKTNEQIISQFQELNASQLMLVGGGVGEVSPY